MVEMRRHRLPGLNKFTVDTGEYSLGTSYKVNYATTLKIKKVIITVSLDALRLQIIMLSYLTDAYQNHVNLVLYIFTSD